MQHIITDEEVSNAVRIYTSAPGIMGAMKEALLDFLTNRPESTLGKLRPIAEMPETVPEGCGIRFSGSDDAPSLTDERYDNDKWFIIVQLRAPTPDPDAEERRKFEEVTEEAGLCSDFRRNENGLYRITETCVAWDAWKLAKAK